MLYTFSQAHYDRAELTALLAQVQPKDVVVLWQDGVLQLLKHPQLFHQPNIFALENDIHARNIASPIPCITLEQFVTLTEQHAPQLAF